VTRTIRSPSRFVRSGARRQTRWLASADRTGYDSIASGAVTLIESFSQATLNDFIPFTIVRTIGLISYNSDQQAASERPFGAVGMAVVSENARAAGVGSLPTPLLDENDDLWFVYAAMASPMQFADATGFIAGGDTFRFESRAMRKVVEGQSIVVVHEQGATVGANFLIKYRILIKLH